MPDNVQSAMFEILKRIQTDVSEVKADVSGLKQSVSRLENKADRLETKGDSLDARMERVERLVRKQIRDNAGMLVMMRATAGEFNERLMDVEEDVRILKEPSR